MPNIGEMLFQARQLAQQEKYLNAIKIYERILDVSPNHEEALMGKGGCHYKQGQNEWARICWTQAIKANPGNEKAKGFLARLPAPPEGAETAQTAETEGQPPPPVEAGKPAALRFMMDAPKHVVLAAASVVLAALLIAVLVTSRGCGSDEEPSKATESVVPVEGERTSFDVILISPGSEKVDIIRAIREVTGLGLKDALDLANDPPSVIKSEVSKEEAEKVKTRLEDSGATVGIE